MLFTIGAIMPPSSRSPRIIPYENSLSPRRARPCRLPPLRYLRPKPAAGMAASSSVAPRERLRPARVWVLRLDVGALEVGGGSGQVLERLVAEDEVAHFLHIRIGRRTDLHRIEGVGIDVHVARLAPTVAVRTGLEPNAVNDAAVELRLAFVVSTSSVDRFAKHSRGVRR